LILINKAHRVLATFYETLYFLTGLQKSPRQNIYSYCNAVYVQNAYEILTTVHETLHF